MSNKPLLFIASFTMNEGLSSEFQEFMEKDHFPKMHKTGCFTGKTQKFLDTASKPGTHSMTYIHFVKSEEKWSEYNQKKEFRPVLKKEFWDKYGAMIECNGIVSIQTVSFPTEV